MPNPDPSASPAASLLEENVEDLYENAPCGYLSTQPDGIVVKVNQTLLTWTGHRRDDLVGRRRFQDLLTAGGRIFYETHLAPLLRMQDGIHEISLEMVCTDGRSLPVLINSVLKKDKAGQPLLYRTTVFNASDRKRYERELLLARQKAEQATRTRADFISMVSHEIRTPLNAIMGVAHLLRHTELSPQQEKLLRILGSSSESLLNLVNDILDFSKIESGKISLEERSLDLRQLVAGTASNLQSKADEKGLALRVEIDERVPASVLGDPIKIGQVLTNLLSNAIKFTAQGSVTLGLQVHELDREAVSIDLRVTDTGIGIAPDQLQRIFEDFSQANYDISLKYGGTGLGLAISKRLVELYGSRLAVESELGQGTTFSFRLRLKIAAEEGAQASNDPSSDQNLLRGLRVLVADDNTVNVYVLTGFLRNWGVEFDVVGNGREVLERITEREYDMVLMDLRMPELDGYSATRQIRSLPDPKRSGLPILAISASTRMGHQGELEAAGFTEFVGKPINPEILFAKMARYCVRRSS